MSNDHIEQQLFTKIGKRGTLVVPAILRKQYNLAEGTAVITEPHPEGVLLKPVTMQPASKEASDAWKKWFSLTNKMNLSPKDMIDMRNEGRK